MYVRKLDRTRTSSRRTPAVHHMFPLSEDRMQCREKTGAATDTAGVQVLCTVSSGCARIQISLHMSI